MNPQPTYLFSTFSKFWISKSKRPWHSRSQVCEVTMTLNKNMNEHYNGFKSLTIPISVITLLHSPNPDRHHLLAFEFEFSGCSFYTHAFAKTRCFWFWVDQVLVPRVIRYSNLRPRSRSWRCSRSWVDCAGHNSDRARSRNFVCYFHIPPLVRSTAAAASICDVSLPRYWLHSQVADLPAQFVDFGPLINRLHLR